MQARTFVGVTTDGLVVNPREGRHSYYINYQDVISSISASSYRLQGQSIEYSPDLLSPNTPVEPPQERIVVDPDVLNGQPHVRGTRIPVAVVIDALAEGLTVEELLGHYPRLTVEDVQAAQEYDAVMRLGGD